MIFLWVNKRAWRQPGPVVNIGLRNAHSLAALGWETHFCVGETETAPASDTAADLRDFYALPPLDALHVHRVARRRTVLGTQSSSSIFVYAARLARTLAKRNRRDADAAAPTLVILTREAAFLPRLLWLRATLPGDVRVFYEAHDFYADISYFAADKRPVKAQDRRQSWLERAFLPRLDGLVCIIGPQCELYARRFPRLRTISLPLGTDPALGEPLSDGELEARRAQRRLVYVGQIHQHKGVRLAMRAAPQFRAAGVRLAFWGGSEKQCAEVREQARAIGCGDTVEAVPFRPPHELHRALAREASLGFVALEPNYYNRLLTCPVKALDYLSHGLPTLATDLPSIRDIFGSASDAVRWLPAADDADAFVRAAQALLDDPAAYARAARAAHRRAEELSWENRARRLVEFVTATDAVTL